MTSDFTRLLEAINKMEDIEAVQLAREDRHRSLVQEYALKNLDRAAEGIVDGKIVRAIFEDIETDLGHISSLLEDGEWDAAANVWGSALGGVTFRSTHRLKPLWKHLNGQKFAPHTTPLEDALSTAIYAILTMILNSKPPTLTAVIAAMSREMSHQAAMGFIHAFQSKEAIEAIRQRARDRKLDVPLSIREALERKTATSMMQRLRPQILRHLDPDDPFEIKDGQAQVMTDKGMRQISVKTRHMPDDDDWDMLDLCFGSGREWDTVSMVILGLFIKHSGLIVLTRPKMKGKKSYKKAVRVQLAKASAAWLEKSLGQWLEGLQRYEPMICRPSGGGYLSLDNPKMTSRRFIPTDEKGNLLITDPEGTWQWKAVVRSMANTRYRYPQRRIQVLRKLHVERMEITGESQFIKQAQLLECAARTGEGEGGVYFPVIMDSRGRTYYRTFPWNPQGDDFAKSLLEADRDDPVKWTEKGSILRHIAIRSLWGNGEDKEAVNLDTPYKTFGVGAEEVYQWEAMFEGEMGQYSNGGPGQLYQIDGTCNGLQHLAALTLDRNTARNVNLCDHPGWFKAGPADVYGVIAKRVIEVLQEVDHNWARRLLNSGLVIDRSFCKKQVMVVPYGAMEATIKKETVKQIYSQIPTLDPTAWINVEDGLGNPDENRREAGYLTFRDRTLKRHPLLKNDANKLGALMLKIIKELLPGPFKIMQVLKAFAKTTDGRAMRWRVSAREDSIWIVQAPVKRYKKHYRTIGLHLPGMAQRLLQYTMRTNREGLLIDHDKIDETAIVKKIVPNFIHSHDADHMARVGSRMAARGHHFTAIHDCFQTTGHGLEELYDITRETFVEKYTPGPEHPFSQPVEFIRTDRTSEDRPTRRWPSWYEAVEEMVGPEARAILEGGAEFNIAEVLDSPFFFS